MSLKDIPFPFSPDSEEEVRFAIAQYFSDLGFGLSDMSFEDHFTITLGRTSVIVNKQTDRKTVHGYSDMLLMHNGQPHRNGPPTRSRRYLAGSQGG